MDAPAGCQRAHDAVYMECVASWADDEAGRRDVWELFRSTPPPLGWDPSPFYGPEEWRSPIFQPLRLDAWRVQVVLGEAMWKGDYYGRIWRADEHLVRASTYSSEHSA